MLLKGPVKASQIVAIGLLFLVLIFATVQIYRLGEGVTRQLQHQAASDVDNIQWNLIQAEVEFLQLQIAAHQTAIGEADVSSVRKRYDILYSRVKTLEESRLYKSLFFQGGQSSNLLNLAEFLTVWLPVIDGPDAELVRKAGDLADAAQLVHWDVRRLVLEGVRRHAKQSDQRRDDISSTLISLAVAVFILVLWLISVVLLLLGMYRRLGIVSRENDVSRGRLEAMVSSSLDAILVIDQQGLVIDCNGAADAVFGMMYSHAVGQSIDALIRPAPGPDGKSVELIRFLASSASASTPDAERLRVTGFRQGGRSFPAEISVSATVSDTENVYVAFLRDISPSVRYEQALERTRDEALAGEKAKGHLLTVMSHEMRTPLNGVVGAVNLLRNQDLTAEQHKYLDAIWVSADLLLHHINDVLELSRLDAGHIRAEASSFDLQSLVLALVESQQPAARAQGNTLSVRCDLAMSEMVSGDPLLVQKALLNLVGNALKFTTKGDIQVDVCRLGDTDTIDFRVSDTGIGISEQDQTRIFEEFVTLDSSFARNAEGTGLGLAITEKMVRTMNGTIGVESVQGEGSQFWMCIPLPHVVDGESARDKQTNALGFVADEPVAILVVEDNEINRMLLVEFLTSCGHTVSAAQDGQSGIACAREQKFDLIFMDISMPGIDGMEAAATIRKDAINRSTPIVALTAHAAEQSRLRFLQDGFVEVITKPFSNGDLRDSIVRWVQRSDQPRSEEAHAGRIADLRSAVGDRRAEQLIAKFMAQTDAFLGRPDLARGSTPELRAEAHNLAGSAAMLGLESVRKALCDVEEAEEEVQFHANVHLLRSAWQQSRSDLGAQVSDPSDGH